jgi:hypothetical protein
LNRTRIIVGLILLGAGVAIFGLGTWYVMQTLDRYANVLEACRVVDCSVAYQQYDVGLAVEGLGGVIAVVGLLIVLVDVLWGKPMATVTPSAA